MRLLYIMGEHDPVSQFLQIQPMNKKSPQAQRQLAHEGLLIFAERERSHSHAMKQCYPGFYSGPIQLCGMLSYRKLPLLCQGTIGEMLEFC